MSTSPVCEGLGELPGQDRWERRGSEPSQGSRWPPDRCDSVVFGVSSLHQRSPDNAVAGVGRVILREQAVWLALGEMSLRKRRLTTAFRCTALLSRPKRRFADNCARAACGLSRTKTCNATLDRQAGRVSRSHHLFITLTANLTYLRS